MGPPILRRMYAASDVGVAESGIKSLVSPLLADTCRGGRGEADFISSEQDMKLMHWYEDQYHWKAYGISNIFIIKLL